MAWLIGWTYRKSHVINYAAGAGTLYQKQITVHYGSGTDGDDDVYLNSHSRTDFSDVRFTDDDGTTLLDYWMEEKVDSDHAVFWVEVADDLSSSNATIYVYYGKSDATTTSNFDNTFIFGDPFDNTTLNTVRWTSVDGNPTYSIDAINHYLEVTNMDTGGYANGKGFHSKTLTFPSQYIVENAYSSAGQEIRLKSDAIAELFGAILCIHHGTWSSSDFGIAFGLIHDWWAASANYGKSAGVGGNEDYYSGALTGSTGIWYSMKTRIWKLSTNIKVELDGTERVNEANSETSTLVHMGISRSDSYAFGNIRVYAFKIRKFASPEPTHGAWGSEETSGPITGWRKLQYYTEPPTAGTFNKLRFASEPPVASAWNRLLYDGE